MAILVKDNELNLHKLPTVKEVGARIEKRLSEYALPLTTKYGSSISLSIDHQTYVLTLQLRDQDGNALGSAKTVDLPLESVVVDGTYDSSTKKILLTLQSGNTIEISVADLVSGLVPESRKIAGLGLDSDISKAQLLNAIDVEEGAQKNAANTVIDANYVHTDNNFTNTDKTKLNDIESGAQVNTVNSVNNKTGNVVLDADDISDANTSNKFVSTSEKDAWNGKQSALSNDQLAAVNSGIDSTKVAKISTNENDITAIKSKIPVSASSENKLVDTAEMQTYALPLTTKYGASIVMSIDSSTYVVTVTLKDQDGNTLGTAQTIDLPLESVVVSGSYDDSTKKVVLTLQNGSTVEFSVADLIDGLVPNSRTIAGLDLSQNRSANELLTALGLSFTGGEII